MINPEDWLTSQAPGYAALKRPERGAIAYFCLLWSLFEAQQMANDANAKRICDQVRQWELRQEEIQDVVSCGRQEQQHAINVRDKKSQQQQNYRNDDLGVVPIEFVFKVPKL
jgi:uncharacterized tellurite resistance protein B-like protein